MTRTWSMGPVELTEEAFEGGRVVGVDRRRARRADLTGRLLQPLGISARQHDIGPLSARKPRRLEADAGAAADHDDGLTNQLRVAFVGH